MASEVQRWVFATSNPHKLREVLEILAPLGLSIRPLSALGFEPVEPDETGSTFAENARLKALSYAAQSGLRCLAEDSGLEVDALGGRPGVHSARYAGLDADRATRDAANNARLLEVLAGVPDEQRTARFVCAMCLADPDGRIVVEVSGSYEGRIARQPHGENGFGYDPLLWLPDLGCTSAQLTSQQKHERSHRGQALRNLLRALTN